MTVIYSLTTEPHSLPLISVGITRETDSEIPSKGTSFFTPMGEITVDPKGVLKLLNGPPEWAKGSQGTWARRPEC